MRLSAGCAHYKLNMYAVLHLLCDRFIFNFLRSWHFNLLRVLIGIVIIDGVQHQLYNPGYVVFCKPLATEALCGRRIAG